MAKRHLTKQQCERIKANQAKKRDRIHAEITAEGPLGAEQTGLLISHYGADVDVEDQLGKIHRCALRQNLPSLVVGDHLVWRAARADKGVVVALQKRKSELIRYTNQGDRKIVAANLTQAFIVCAVQPEFSKALLDCYLAAARLSGLQAVVVFNKVDLLDEATLREVNEQLTIYEKIGYKICLTSCEKAGGVEALQACLKDEISVFVGQSGVGKSSLINHFIEGANIAVGELSAMHNMGKHTTTTSRLYHLKQGGDLIDSPGVREFGLGKITMDALFDSFIEFSEFKGKCKFRDCKHQSEPECALKTALESGEINQSRFDSFQHLLEKI